MTANEATNQVVKPEFKVSAADFVAWCPAELSLSEVQNLLSKHQLMLPVLGSWWQSKQTESLLKWSSLENETLANLIGWNWPHFCDSTHGSWINWLLGAHVKLADGTQAKSGSSVTKSVAGFEAHKLLVGSRGTLLTPELLILRVIPIIALKIPEIKIEQPQIQEKLHLVHKVKKSQFNQMVNQNLGSLVCHNRSNSTLWHHNIDVNQMVRSDGDSIITLDYSEAQVGFASATQSALNRAKSILDPDNLLGKKGLYP